MPRSGFPAFWLAAAGIAAAALAAGIWLANTQHGTRDAAPQAAQILYGQRLPLAQGGELDLATLRGRPVVLNFWATWCAPCVDEMPELQALSREFGATPVRFVGLGIDSPGNMAEFRTRYGIDYPLPVAGAAGTELARQFGNASGGLPFTVVLDEKGLVRYRKIGRVDGAELRAQIRQIVGG
jgi:thiol-disulfide isomerase/thioredoxin